ncbi:hypothetical protein FKM82_013778 [Ascaphus truei]
MRLNEKISVHTQTECDSIPLMYLRFLFLILSNICAYRILALYNPSACECHCLCNTKQAGPDLKYPQWSGVGIISVVGDQETTF